MHGACAFRICCNPGRLCFMCLSAPKYVCMPIRCKRVMLGDCADVIAGRIMTGMASRRGANLPFEVADSDDRLQGECHELQEQTHGHLVVGLQTTVVYLCGAHSPSTGVVMFSLFVRVCFPLCLCSHASRDMLPLVGHIHSFLHVNDHPLLSNSQVPSRSIDPAVRFWPRLLPHIVTTKISSGFRPRTPSSPLR